jgi:Major capsid protein N-terminus/Large eukaryotic DNA virus major capsid protein
MASTSAKPVGELKKIVSLIDRSDFDEYVYPPNSSKTKFRPENEHYHNFTQETATWTFQGSPNWGQRITFAVPWPWQGDFLNWIALRLKPLTWLPGNTADRIGPNIQNLVPLDEADFFVWAQSLGTIAIAKAEMEVDGVIIETFSGDWINTWNKMNHSVTTAVAYDDGIYNSYVNPTVNNVIVSEDGYIYCYLPFWFAKHVNTAFPLISCSGPNTIRFHITLRPFSEVIRKIGAPLNCGETPLGTSFQVRDYTYPFRKFETITVNYAQPGFQTADLVCGISHIDGELREAYMHDTHEILMEQVVETQFSEPIKYVTNTSIGNTIKIQLPITTANGPIRQLIFFLRRNATVRQYNNWNNYSALLENEYDPVWNPYRPLLVHAQLMVGTAIWADQPERWWRATGNVVLPGGIRGYGNYIYAYNFAEKPAEFDPSGTLNPDRVDMKLSLVVAPPGGSADAEWTVSLFVVGTNWIRFQNGLSNLLFMD